MKILNFLKLMLLLSALEQVWSITQEKLYSADGKKFYYIENEYKYDWFESLTKCASMNMTLLTIDSKPKSEEINNVVKKAFGKNIILWVGGYAVGSNRQFRWVSTGEEFTYTYWHGANPDFTNSEEYCMQIGWSATMAWNDNKCTKKFGFICEFKPQECSGNTDDKNYKYHNIIINNLQKY
ncbi:lectin subunit alpha-like [Lucilia sericata]|uniref:lectin subunit alpha-like n=1 Tax=Lucilia sericata TaxID=13632 RepID=UPI0018A80960|nr:lectin subunit alpha-like [Lucilia sericata]